jgi:hypothetical protein
MPAEFAGYFDFRWLMVGAVHRGKPGLSSPVQLAPVIKPSFPICTICIATFFGLIFIWLVTLDWRTWFYLLTHTGHTTKLSFSASIIPSGIQGIHSTFRHF